MCDEHPDRPAQVRLQGETDSFGCEMADLCAECAEAALQERLNNPMVGRCDWCKTDGVQLHPRRDFEEGMSGPVYHVCSPCIKRSNDRLAEEEAEHDDGDYDFGDYDDRDDDDDLSDFIDDDPAPEPEQPDPNVKFSDAAAEYRAQRRDEERAAGDGWQY